MREEIRPSRTCRRASPSPTRTEYPYPSAFPSGRANIVRLVGALLAAAFPLFHPQHSQAKERGAVVTVKVDLKAPAEAKNVNLWIPYPMSDEHQEVTGVSVSGNYSASGVYREGKSGNGILHAVWDGPAEGRTLTYTFRVVRKEVVVRNPAALDPPIPSKEMEVYLASTRLGATGGPAKEIADRITSGKNTQLSKASAIYEWIVENMRRDPGVKGCGLGEVDNLLRTLGGKCADINSVFVTLARASGIPAREVFGIRIPSGKNGDMTKAQHCWAEFHLDGFGWVVVDPADVRKAILEKKMTLAEAKPIREYYFGAVDENRIAFGTGRDLVLNPPQIGEPLNYFMYPYAEADGKPLNEDLFGFNLGTSISFREH